MRLLVLLLFFLPLATPSLAQQATEPAESTKAEAESLIRILEDDEARSRLISNLRAAAGEAPADEPSVPAVSEDMIAHQIAEYTRTAAEDAAHMLGTMVGLVRQVADVLSGATRIDTAALWNVVRNVALVIAATFTAYLILQLAFQRLQRRLASVAAGSSPIWRTGFIVLAAAVDAATIFAAWAVGHVAALNVDQPGQLGINRAMFLNAFLVIELIKVAARTLFAPRWPALRIGATDDTMSAYWYFWLSRLVSVVGYTFLFIAPIIAANVSRDAAEVVSVIVMLAALVMSSVIVLQNRDAVRERLIHRARTGKTDTFSKSLAAISRIWHVIAIAYFALNLRTVDGRP